MHPLNLRTIFTIYPTINGYMYMHVKVMPYDDRITY